MEYSKKLIIDEKNINFYRFCKLECALDNNYDWDEINEIKQHGYRVSIISVNLAINLGLDKESIEAVKICGLLHDIGKFNIDSNIINKKENLTKYEYELIKTHVEYSKIFMENMGWHEYEEIVLYHHERMDGSGYYKLKGKDIPLLSKIIAIADVYDALNSNRPYRKAYRNETALKIMEKEKCKYDKRVYKIFKRLYSKDKKINMC